MNLAPAINLARASYQIARASLQVLRAHPRLMLFPALSATAAITVALVLLSPVLDGVEQDNHWLAFGAYLAIHAVASFFAVALTHQALLALRGDNISVVDGLRYSASRVTAVGGYALVHATFGALLGTGNRRAHRAARTVFGVAWQLVTYLALPIMVQERRGVIDSLRRSGDLFKRTWGETAVAEIAVRVLTIQFYAFVIALCILLAHLFDEPALPIVLLAVVMGLSFTLFASTLQAIYRAALYIFAAEGVVPDAFDTPEMHDVWKVK